VGIEALAYSVALPHLPLVVGRNAPWWAVGLLFGGYSVMQFVAIGPIGRLAERHGVRRVTAACLVGTAVGLMMTALSTNYWILLGGRLVDGVSAGTVVVVTTSVLARVPRAEWTHTLGLLSGVRGTAGLIGILATAGVGVAIGDPVVGLRTMAWIGTGLVGASLVLVPRLPSLAYAPLTTINTPIGTVTRYRLISHFGAQAAQAGLLISAPGVGAAVASVKVGFYCPAAAIIGLAVGQALVSSRAERSATIRTLMIGVLTLGLVGIPFPATVVAGFAVAGVAIGSLAPRLQAALIRERMADGISAVGANVLAGRGAVAGQVAGPMIGYAALSWSPSMAAVSVGLFVLLSNLVGPQPEVPTE